MNIIGLITTIRLKNQAFCDKIVKLDKYAHAVCEIHGFMEQVCNKYAGVKANTVKDSKGEQ